MSQAMVENADADDAHREVLIALRDLADALDRMHNGIKDDMGMNATDLSALRMLTIRADRGEPVSPHDLASYLQITTASTTKLIDRLSAAGYVERRPHPYDRRARVVVLTDHARREFFAHFREVLAVMRRVTGRFETGELAIVNRFLEGMTTGLHAFSPAGRGATHRH